MTRSPICSSSHTERRATYEIVNWLIKRSSRESDVGYLMEQVGIRNILRRGRAITSGTGHACTHRLVNSVKRGECLIADLITFNLCAGHHATAISICLQLAEVTTCFADSLCSQLIYDIIKDKKIFSFGVCKLASAVSFL